MRPLSCPTLLLIIAVSSCLALAVACGGGEGETADGTQAGSAEVTQAATGTPYALGPSFTIRGQEVQLPAGATMTNQSPECWPESVALTAQCAGDLKLIARGDSYILFDPTIPRVLARQIKPEDDADFRPLLALISGTTGRESASPAPSS